MRMRQSNSTPIFSILLLTMLLSEHDHALAAEEGVGYSPSLNGDVTDNALILPSSGGAPVGSNVRPFIQLHESSSNALVVPLPESSITEEPTHGKVKTQTPPVYIK